MAYLPFPLSSLYPEDIDHYAETAPAAYGPYAPTPCPLTVDNWDLLSECSFELMEEDPTDPGPTIDHWLLAAGGSVVGPVCHDIPPPAPHAPALIPGAVQIAAAPTTPTAPVGPAPVAPALAPATKPTHASRPAARSTDTRRAVGAPRSEGQCQGFQTHDRCNGIVRKHGETQWYGLFCARCMSTVPLRGVPEHFTLIGLQRHVRNGHRGVLQMTTNLDQVNEVFNLFRDFLIKISDQDAAALSAGTVDLEQIHPMLRWNKKVTKSK